MGGSSSLEEIQRAPCFPRSEFTGMLSAHADFKIDVGIDESLLRYSGIDSTAKLQGYSSELLTELGSNIPEYVEKVGTALAGISSVPNAVGIGALALSMILHVCFAAAKGSSSKSSDPENLLRRVFADEKSSEVRVLMNEYLTRYTMFLKDNGDLLQETIRLEQQLSHQLKRVKDSMGEHMSDKAFKHWTNGAAFHAQMLIHIARLKQKIGDSNPESTKHSLHTAINSYNTELSELMENYKVHKARYFAETKSPVPGIWAIWCCKYKKCCDTKCDLYEDPNDTLLIPKLFISYIFSGNSEIIELQKYFTDLLNNYQRLINQSGTFQAPRKQ